MKLKPILSGGQACWALFLLFFLAACNGKKEEAPVIPPLTSPLSQSFVGYGVVNVSYTRVAAVPEGDGLEGTDGPNDDAASGSYLRQGSVVRILQRRQINNQDKLESWVQVDAGLGWLRESLVDVYDSEAQARTASEAMGR
jgi:hypothetical protein